MSYIPILQAPGLIQFHACVAMVALILGPIAIHRKRRDRLHKVIGYVWVLAMLAVAISALFIPSFDLALVGHLGPIHLLALLALFSVAQGMLAIWRRDLRTHERAMSGLYYQGLLIAGLFNFLPGRVVNRTLFPDIPEAGIAVILVGGAALIWFRWLRGRVWRHAV